ncbi:hypothetical protein GCM10010232_69030 [Streptomyces amakusaensis]|uniref:Chaplin domain-containing protein n=2 Tax=Streptomyces TaxID=1883 RepID=A0A918QAT6_9ACTN|nr:hypothetical protein [Streptomyces inusitatus]GGZ38002.1 hypothetical protein GCM10010387_35050 [Streptomyces inusitatus]
MRVRAVLTTLALTAAGILGTTTAASALDFGDIVISSEQNPNVVVGCSPHWVVLSPSVQCGVFHITAP